MNELRIREMNDDEKPREKMISKGIKSLSDAELLAILIRVGNKNINAISLSSKLIKNCGGNIRELHDMTIDELCCLDGIGKSKACIIKAAIELGSRISSYIPNKFKIGNPWDVYRYYMEDMRFLKKEVFKVILLNTKNEILKDIDISIGSLNSSIVHPREVFKEAIRYSSNAIILMHNHPSGNPSPSQEDIKVTQRLNKCGDLLGIEILDHIVIGDGEYYSMKENDDF